MLRRWDLEPLIIDQLASKGQTIIEKLEEYTGQANFGIVLATPDDVGYAKDHEDDKNSVHGKCCAGIGNVVGKNRTLKSCDSALAGR